MTQKRVALVTGAGSGIGKSAALALLKDGYYVGLVGRRKDMLEKTAAESAAKDRAAPIERIAVPTLVITGDEDRVYPPAMARDIARRIPGAELVTLKGIGHLSNLEQPDEFNQAVLDFLIRQEKRS